MKKIYKAICFVLSGFILQMAIPIISISAAANPHFVNRMEWCVDQTCDGETGGTLEIINCPKDAKITNLKNSNPNAVRIEKGKLDGIPCITFFPLKVGTSKITFNLKWGKNVKKFVHTYIGYRYISPVKSFRVGSKDYTKKFKVRTLVYQKLSSNKILKNQNIRIKLKPGWVKSSIELRDSYGTMYKEIKNNAKITIKPGREIRLWAYNKKLKRLENIILCFE